MSYSTMYRVEHSGPMVELKEFGNAHGSAPRVWDAIAKKYFGGKHWMMMSDQDSKAFWALGKDERLSLCEKVAFWWTFDHAIVEREKAREVAALLRQFDQEHPREPGYVNHLPAIADALDEHADDDCIGFAFTQTSVAADSWQVQDRCPDDFHDKGDPDDCCETCGNERDDRRMWRTFDWSKDHETAEHYFVFASAAPTPPEPER